MSKITLPTNIFSELTQNTNKEIYTEISVMSDRIIEELNYFTDNYVDEQELKNYFACRYEYFTNLVELLLVYESEEQIFYKIEEIEELKFYNLNYINLADGIANLFEEFKSKLQPSVDLDLALKMHDPSFITGKNENFYDLDYTEINRLIQIYLLKESLEGIDYKICNGVLILHSKNLELKLTLCGDINNPQWKVFDINRDNKVKYLMELPSSIKSLITLIKIYEGKEECRQIFNILSKDIYLKKYIKGSTYDFLFDFILLLKIKITSRGCHATVQVDNTKQVFKKEILKNYEKEVERLLKKIDKRVEFTIENKIILLNSFFNSILELNEYLYLEREDKCFYSIFKNQKIKKDFLKEKYGNKNVFLLYNECIFIFKLEKLVYNENYDDSELYLKVYFVKSLCDSLILPEQMFLSYDGNKLFLHKKGNIQPIKVKYFSDFINNFDFSSISYTTIIENDKIKIFKDELEIQEGIKINRKKDFFTINNTFCIKDLGKIKDFLYFINGIAIIKKQDYSYNEENTFLCEYKELEFSLSFENGIKAKSGNDAIQFYLSNYNFITHLDTFYLFIYNSLFPSSVYNSFIIFDFSNSLETKFIFKTHHSSYFLKKNDFIDANFSSKDYNDYYKIIEPDDLSFFNIFKSMYITDRFINLIIFLKERFKTADRNNELIILNRSELILSLCDNKVIIESQNKVVSQSDIQNLIYIFYYKKDYLNEFGKFIDAYEK